APIPTSSQLEGSSLPPAPRTRPSASATTAWVCEPPPSTPSTTVIANNPASQPERARTPRTLLRRCADLAECDLPWPSGPQTSPNGGASCRRLRTSPDLARASATARTSPRDV